MGFRHCGSQFVIQNRWFHSRQLSSGSDPRHLAFFNRGTMSAENVAIGDIYTLPLTSDLRPAREPTRLTSDNVYVGGIAWTADSRETVFSSGRGDSPG